MTKRYLITLFVIVILLGASLFISSFKKQIKVVGFAYNGDVILVRQSNVTLQTVVVDTNNIDSNKVCSFYEVFNYYAFENKVNLTVEIDSGKRMLLDTVLVFTEKNKMPFISFLNPRKTRYKRDFFIGDDADHPLY